jgi:signal transduction histidine kinase
MNDGRRRSLFWSIAGLLLVAAGVGTLLQVLVTTSVLKPLEAREERSRAELMAVNIAGDLAAADPFGTPVTDTLLFHHRRAFTPPAPWLFYRTVAGSTYSEPPGRERYMGGLLDGSSRPGATTDTLGRPVPWSGIEVLARRPVVRGATKLGEIVLARPIRPRTAAAGLGQLTSLLFLPIALILSVGTAIVLVRLLVRRLSAIETLAARVAEGDLSVRIDDPSGDEIGRLAERLDRMTERLAEARDRIASSEKQRRQLFADITHELATPLTSIRGYAETLQDQAVRLTPEERSRFVRGLLEEAQRLDRAIRDLFELARLEAGASALLIERLDWVALCRNTVERFAPRFAAARLRVVWKPSLTEAWIEADGRRMEQVLENLLVNALRYVPAEGSVTLAMSESESGGRRFRLEVRDDGPGLAPDELDHVFERFYRTPSARGVGGSRDGGGSGLGLAIVREIVERHGGTVSAHSARPHGLEIHVEIPAGPTAGTPARAAHELESIGGRNA